MILGQEGVDRKTNQGAGAHNTQFIIWVEVDDETKRSHKNGG